MEVIGELAWVGLVWVGRMDGRMYFSVTAGGMHVWISGMKDSPMRGSGSSGVMDDVM